MTIQLKCLAHKSTLHFAFYELYSDMHAYTALHRKAGSRHNRITRAGAVLRAIIM